MKNPNAGNVGKGERGRSKSIVARSSSVAPQLQAFCAFLIGEALAVVLLLELGRPLAGAVAA